MTLYEAIEHCEEQIKNEKINGACQKEHKLLALWLEELSIYRKILDITPNEEEIIKRCKTTRKNYNEMERLLQVECCENYI